MDHQLSTSRVRREIAARVGNTERQIQRIVSDLEEGGHLTKTRDGRGNVYQIHRERVLEHAAPGGRTVGDLLQALERRAGAPPAKAQAGDERSTGA